MTMIDATKWGEFYQEMTKDLKPYDHYDDGYRDAMDNADDWMDGNQVEAEPVRHGRWSRFYKSGVKVDRGFVSSCCDMWNERTSHYCPNCGARMEEGDD